jgi:hypothetical protein
MIMRSTRARDDSLTKLPLLELYSLSSCDVTLDVYESAYLAVTSVSFCASPDRYICLEKIETLRQIHLPLLDIVRVGLLVQHPRPF